MIRVMKLLILGSKTFIGQVFTCNFSMICSQDQKPGASLPRFAPWLDGDAEDAPAPALARASSHAQI